MKIFIDKKYETVVMPVFGIATPFHIATIKVRPAWVESASHAPYKPIRTNMILSVKYLLHYSNDLRYVDYLSTEVHLNGSHYIKADPLFK